MAAVVKALAILTVVMFACDVGLCNGNSVRYIRFQCGPLHNRSISSMFNEVIVYVFNTIGREKWAEEPKRFIYCVKRGLTSVPQYLERDVQVLDLKSNMITYIGPSAFARYTELEGLSLVENCCLYDSYYTLPKCTDMVIHKDAFRNMRKLKYINLSYNTGSMGRLPELPQSLIVLYASFSNLLPVRKDYLNVEKLEVVDLSGNCRINEPKIFCLKNFAIQGKILPESQIRYLDLSFNNFTSVPTHLLSEKLEVLVLRENPISVIRSNDFLKTAKLKYLVLSFTSQLKLEPLRILGNPFQHLKELQHLDLSGNMLDTVPSDFLVTNLKLKNLQLQLNCFKRNATDPTILPHLPNLISLDMTANNMCNKQKHPTKPQEDLMVLGKSFLQFPKLEIFSLGYIEGFRWESKYLTYGTNYHTVNGSSFVVLSNLTRFRFLNIAYCGINTFNTSAWAEINNISNVDARINHIGEAKYKTRHTKLFSSRSTKHAPKQVSTYSTKFGPGKIFQATKYTLTLKRNAIYDIRSINFENCAFVKYLDLSYNRINYIYSDTFRPMSNLRHVDLRWNPIRIIEDFAFRGLRSFSFLQLHVTIYENDLSLGFLSGLSRPVKLNLAGLNRDVYYLLASYAGSNMTFGQVHSLTASRNAVPTKKLLNTESLFAVFPNLVYLSFTYAWLHLPLNKNFFGGLPRLRYLDIKSNGIEIFPTLALLQLSELVSLDISRNFISTVPGKDLEKFTKLKYLNLNHNKLRNIYYLHKLPALVSLRIEKNEVTDIGPKAMNRTFLTRLKHLDLRWNALQCECSLATTFGWFISSVKNVETIYYLLPRCPLAMKEYFEGCVVCQSGEKYISLLEYSTSHACELDFVLALTLAYSNFVATFLSVVLLLNSKWFKRHLVLHVHKNIRKSVIMRKESAHAEPIDDSNYPYDAFIAHDHLNEKLGAWVANCLVPELETGEPSFRVCMSGRDDFCGTTQVVQLLMKMRISRKTIIVFNHEFATSPKYKYMLSVLENGFYESGVDRCVLVAFGIRSPAPLLNMPSCVMKNKHKLFLVPEDVDSLVDLWQALKTALIVKLDHKDC